MTTENFKDLEKLLKKLELHVGHRYALIPNHINGGCHIAIYDSKGEMIRQLNGESIEFVSNKII
jgi:hypothetical protein